MTKIDWSKAPEGAEFYIAGCFYKRDCGVYKYSFGDDDWDVSLCQSHDFLMRQRDYEPRPQQWPSESRIDIIGTNGNTAEHYMDEFHEKVSTGPSVYEARKHYETQSELAARLKVELEAKQKAETKQKTVTTASDFLSEGLRILSERGKQYDPSGTKEMSFDNVAEAFNCLTNSRLKGSDVCLLLALLKVVRQNANKDFHEDSAVDFVNYAALHGEILKGEKA